MLGSVRPKVLYAAIIGLILCAGLGFEGPNGKPGLWAQTPSDGQSPDEDTRPAVRPIRASGLKAEVAALIMSGQQGGRLPIEIFTIPVHGDGDKVRVPLTLEIAGAPLVESHGDTEGPMLLEIYVYALSSAGALQGSLIQNYEIDFERLGSDLRSGLEFEADLDLRPGEYSLRVLVRNPRNSDVGMLDRPLSVATAEAPLMTAPLFEESPEAWLPIRPGRERGMTRREALPFLEQVNPAARAVLAADAEVNFRVLARNLEGVGSNLDLEVHTTDGPLNGENLLETLGAKVTGYSAPDAHGFRTLEASFDASALTPGLYRLRVVHGGTLRSPAIPAIVVASDPDRENSPIAWSQVTTAMLSRAAFATPQAAVEQSAVTRRPPRRRQKVDKDFMRSVEEEYRAVLSKLADGEVSGARRALFDLELKGLSKGMETLDALGEVQLDIASQIAEAESEALGPVVFLHHWLYRESRVRQLPLISTHARSTTLEMVEIFLRGGRSVDTKRQAAALLVSLGCELQRSGMARLSERLLQRVLSLEETNPVALLNLAVSSERRGDYEIASGILNDLVEAHPNHGHGRLRLAINLQREGRIKAAQKHFETVLEGEHPRWILALTYQELGNLHLRAERFEEARALLEQGAERLPGQEKVLLQLAFVYDALQKPWKAQEALLQMEIGQREGPSPRHLYTQWPTESLQETRRFLEDSMMASVKTLGTALEASAMQAGGRR